jgi:hypothetical protein
MVKRKNLSAVGPSASFVNEEGKLLLDAIIHESDRAAVLITAAFLDNVLEGCLLAQCKQRKINVDVTNLLLGEPKGIVGHFGARIPVCWLLGFIDEGIYNALHAIGKIRNAFAHSDFAVTFQEKKVREHIESLRKWIKATEVGPIYGVVDGLPQWRVDLNLAGEIIEDPPSPRHVYLAAVTILYVTLHHVRWQIRRGEYSGAVPVTIW